MSSTLEAEALSVVADLGGRSIPVLRDVSFRLEAGRILGVVGESGAGKSMLAKSIAQHLPSRFSVGGGTLRFAGDDLARMEPERRRALLGREIAFVPQEPLTSLNPVLTIGRQFDEHLERLGVSASAERRHRAAGHLADVRLREPAELLDRYPHQLSGGMCQRVLIAMAFASKPKLVVADEPTTALDVTIQAHVIGVLRDLQRAQGTAVVLITHDLRLAAQVCDDILVLYAGRPVEYGPARDIFEHPAHPYTRCLQLASPVLEGPRRALIALPEHMPTLASLANLTGCRFAPRCPLRGPDCAFEPPIERMGGARIVACLRRGETQTIGSAASVALPATASSAEPIVRVEGLGKRYRSTSGLFRTATDVTALAEVSFDIGGDEFLGLVGESGSGKSTVAKVLLGIERPSEGRVLIAGHDVGDPSPKARAARTTAIQMVFQDPQSALNPRRCVADIVTQAMIAGRRHANWEERVQRTREILAEVGMPPDLAMRYPAELSGGQRQRINIARALCSKPKVLVADEIVSGLDVSVQAQLLNLLERLRRELGFAMLFISHDLSVVRHLCARVLVMHRGRIVESGQTEAVFARPASDYAKALIRAVPPDDLSRQWRPFVDAEVLA